MIAIKLIFLVLVPVLSVQLPNVEYIESLITEFKDGELGPMDSPCLGHEVLKVKKYEDFEGVFQKPFGANEYFITSTEGVYEYCMETVGTFLVSDYGYELYIPVYTINTGAANRTFKWSAIDLKNFMEMTTVVDIDNSRTWKNSTIKITNKSSYKMRLEYTSYGEEEVFFAIDKFVLKYPDDSLESTTVTDEPTTEDTTPTPEDTTAVTDEPTTEDITPTPEDTTAVTDESTTEETTPTPEDTTAVTDEPTTEDTTPTPEDTTAVTDEPTTEDTTPTPEDTTAVTDEPTTEDTTPTPEDTTAVTDEPTTEDTTPTPEDTTAVTDEPTTEDTTPTPEDTTAVTEDTTPEPEDTTAVTDDTSTVTEDTTAATNEPTVTAEPPPPDACTCNCNCNYYCEAPFLL